MKKYEHDLKKLIDLSEGGCELVHQEQTGLSEAELRFLAAKGFLRLHPAGDDEFWLLWNQLAFRTFQANLRHGNPSSRSISPVF